MNRIEILHTESSCGWGGQELRVIEESRLFLEQGHGVVIAAPPESRIADEARTRAVPLVVLPLAKRSFAGILALRRHLASRKIDIINTHSSTDSWLVALTTRTLAAAPKMVRTRHVSAPIPNNWPSHWLYRTASEHVITTGVALREQVIRETGLDSSRITSVPTGLDLRRFSPGDRRAARAALGIAPDAFVIGIVATLRSWKGHRFLVEAFASHAREGSRLLMVGDGPGAENLRRQVLELGIESQVSMPGNQADVVPWLRAMDIFVLPSYANEGVPQALMQAQACGIPVISTAVGSIAEIVSDGETGLLVTPSDVASLGAAIIRLRNDATLRQKLAAGGLAQAEERYSDRTMFERMNAVFRQVLEGRVA
ncbi:MAG: glycosyltransferase family 4 protein [Burkholderiales bacterium]